MRAAIAVGALALAATSVSAAATSIVPPSPHHPDRAYCAMTALVGAIDRRDRASLSGGIKIYSDALGEVTGDEFDRFFAEFAATGSSRAQPLRVTRFAVLEPAEVVPIYVMTVRRGGGDGSHWSIWIVQFEADDIRLLRRADELWALATSNQHFFVNLDCPRAAAHG